MGNSFNVNTIKGGNSRVDGKNYLLEQTINESATRGTGEVKLASRSRYEVLVVDKPNLQHSNQATTGSRRNVTGTKTLRRTTPSVTAHKTRKSPKNRASSDADTSGAAGRNNSNISIANKNTTASGTNTDAVRSSNATVAQSNNITKPVVASASSLAKERETMHETLNGLLQGVMGKNGFVAPTDHRSYTAMITKAANSIKNPAQREAFIAKIEEAGKPFRLNFGLSRTVGGKKEALNSKSTASLSTLHQEEYKKIQTEFQSKSNTRATPNVSQGQQNNQGVDGNRGIGVKPTPTPTPAKTPIQTSAPGKVPAPAADANTSIFSNPELIA
jgi:hypothetical protein